MKGFIKFTGMFLAYSVLSFALASCESNRKPDHILSEQEMVKVLSEIYINEEKVVRLALPPDSAAAVFSALNERLMADLSVPDSVFKASLEYYMTKPVQLEKIYGVLVDSLQLREQRTPYRSNPQ